MQRSKAPVQNKASVPLRKVIGGQLKTLRERRQLSVNDIATKAKIDRITVQRIEKGAVDCRLDSLGAYLAACGSSLVEFFCGTALPNARHIDQEHIDRFLRILNDRRYRKTAIDFVEVLDRAIREGGE